MNNHELFFYDANSGKIFWKERPRSHFDTDRGWKKFNTSYAGKEAGAEKLTNKGETSHRHVGCLKKPTHKIVLEMHGVYVPSGMEVDHISGDSLDNRVENLRVVTRQENMRNKRQSKKNTSGCTGVFFYVRYAKWCAQIRDGSRNVCLGYFTKKSDAIARRKKEEVALGYHPNHGRIS